MGDNLARTPSGLRPRDFLDILGTPWIVRDSTIFFYCLAIFIPTVASEYSRLNNPDLLSALMVALISVLTNGTVLLLVRPAIITLSTITTWGVLGVLVAVGATRALVTSAAVALTDVESESYLLTRVGLGVVSSPVMLAFVALVVSRITTTRLQRRSTRQAISEAAAVRDDVLHTIDESNARFLREVDERLRPAVNSILGAIRLPHTPREMTAERLDKLADDVVRPLSHSLAEAGSGTNIPRGSSARRVSVPPRPSLTDYLNPYFSALGVGLGGFSVMIDGLEPSEAITASLIAGVSTFALLSVARFVLRGKILSTRASALAVGVLHEFVWLPGQLINDVLIFPDVLIVDYVILGIATTPLLGLLHFVIIFGGYSGRQQLAILDAARVNMVLQQSEARRSAWLRQRHVAHTLHSSMQSRLHAQARLLRSGTGRLTETERDTTELALQSVLEVAAEKPFVEIDAIESLTQLIEFWSGMCDISLTVGEGVADALSGDPEASEALSIVSLEIVSNAIRHGHATQVDIDITRDTDETIRVRAVNDGQLLDASHRPGLGMAIYEELAADWSVTNDDRVVVEAVIAARGNVSV